MTTDTRTGSWMQTFTGLQFFPMDPRPEDVDPTDIAHALSLICRYGGHTTRFYSVAEHCLLMSHAVPEEYALWALLHDATEAYVGDMVRPLKQHMQDYRAAEMRVWDAITLRFGLRRFEELPPPMPAAVKDADNRIILDERAAVMAPTEHRWEQDDLQPLGVRVEGLPPHLAEYRYTVRLRDLTDLGPWQWPGDGRG